MARSRAACYPGGVEERDREVFVEWLRHFWLDNDEAEAEALWRTAVRVSPSLAREYLAAVGRVLARPPADLREIMSEHGWISLYHQDRQPWEPRSHAEYVAWLWATAGRFRQILSTARSEEG